MTSARCYHHSPGILSRTNCTPEASYLIHSWFHLGECWVQKNKIKKKRKLQNKRSLFYLPFGEMHCSDMNKVHLVCWIKCKLLITQSKYLYNCLYFFMMILERNVFIFLTSVPDVSSVGLTLWLVWWDSYLCIEPLLWWILCMQCLGNTVGEHGEELILGAFDQFVFIYFIILLINCEKQHVFCIASHSSDALVNLLKE